MPSSRMYSAASSTGVSGESARMERLITSLSMICPFEPREKQALLEAPTLADRGRLMIRMVEMAILGGEGEEGAVRH